MAENEREEIIMTENDIIAEYVKREFPEILNTLDFEKFKILYAMTGFWKELEKNIKRIDFSKLQKIVKALNESEKEGGK